MKKLLLFLFIVFPVLLKAQSWYPIGATWYYNYQEEVSFQADGYTKYTVVKDTVVDAKPSKIITTETVRYNGDTHSGGSLIVREENSKVYYYNNSTFQLMYDFTLKVGDTLAININGYACDSVSPLIVDSIKSLNINGTNLKVQYVKGIYYIDSTFGGQIATITYTIIEKIGYTNSCSADNVDFFFNPVCSVGDEFVWDGFRCYNDSNISYKGCFWASFFHNAPCDTLINGTTGISELSNNKTRIELFPNPSSDFVTIKSVSAINNIDVYDFCGELISNFQPKCNDFTVNIESYPPGIYFFYITANNLLLKNYYKIIKL